MVSIGNDWDEKLKGEFEKEYYLNLRKFLINEYRTREIYPDMFSIFNALKLTPYSEVKAVILGQDPYHEPGQAHGLCFSVNRNTAIPPSLVNIYKELNQELGVPIPPHGNLEDWAESGVLLLNAVLTVRRGLANSHRGKGWEIFTDHVIELLSQREKPMVFILWGNNARTKKALIDTNRHLVLEGAHPSPLSAHKGFFGGNYFKEANEFLSKQGETIDWTVRI